MTQNRTATRRFGLSKSKIIAFEQCPKKLWLATHRPELAEQDEGAEARFATGNAVGEIACALHPGGVMVDPPSLSEALAKTSSLITGGHPGPIFEATFEHDGVLVRVDVLEKVEGAGWAAAEVKSSGKVKDYHRGDLATQVWVMRKAGIELKRAAIRHIDTSFVLSREGDYTGLFVDADLLDELEGTIATRPALVAEARATLSGDEPEREMGDHCSAPFACEFATYCSRDLPPGPEWPVTVLPYGGGKRWLERGVDDLLDLAESDLNDRHARILAATRDGIPRITVMPKGEVKAGFNLFTLDLSGMRYPAPSDELWAKHLRTDQVDIIGMSQGNLLEERLEDYVVSGLIDFSDIAYDEHADLLYELAGQVARHFLTYLSETDAGQVLSLHQREIARAVHAQMQDHFWKDEAVEYHHEIRQGFSELKETAFTASREAPLDYRVPPADKSNMARYLFGGFVKCLSTVAKFHSDTERKLAVILEREALKWLRPAKGQFQMYYRSGHDHLEYQPDFVAETDDYILMLEPKMATQMQDKDVLAKREVAIQWCAWASEHARSYGGKPWRYALIPHDAIAENMTLEFLMKQFG